MSPRRQTFLSLVFACIFISIIADDTVHSRKAQILQNRWFVFFNLFSLILHWLPETTIFPSLEKKNNQEVEATMQSCPSTWSLRCLRISLNFFFCNLSAYCSSLIRLYLNCFFLVLLYMNYIFFYFLTGGTRQLDYFISSDILMELKYFLYNYF